jgi:putative transposase
MNRSAGRLSIFHDDGDYAAFERVLAEAVARDRMRVCAHCLMPNHFHLVLWPDRDGMLSRFMQWLTMTHTQRYRAWHESAGQGHLYQGRFRSFPIQEDWHFLSVCRYVERNALRAGLVARAEEWRWSSLWRRERGGPPCDWLCDWPVDRPADWVARVNAPETAAELDAIRRCARRGQPYGAESWVGPTARRLGLAASPRPRGRPRKVRSVEVGTGIQTARPETGF